MMVDPLDSFISLASRQAKDEDGNTQALVKVFISFQLIGLFGILIMLITVLCSRSIQRHSTWYSFTFSWVISTVSSTLLFWDGSLTEKEPTYTICLIQGVMSYAGPPLTAGTTLALVIQIWSSVRAPAVSWKGSSTPPFVLTALLVVPYLFYAAFLVGTLVIGWQDPHTVRRVGSGMYCSFANRLPGRLAALFVSLAMVPCVVLEILVCRALQRRWALFKKQPDALSMALRVVAFTFVGMLAATLSIVLFFMVHHGADLNIVISTLPVAAVLIFGTQADLVRVWMFWRKRPDPPIAHEKDSESDTATISDKSSVIDIHA